MITNIFKDGLMMVKAEDAIKIFDIGEGVRIISGAHSGEVGLIAEIQNDRHAVITLESTNSELKILLSNLRSKNCE